MSIKFAEGMLDSMVDGQGHCGERGLSEKQFDILSAHLIPGESEWVNAWHGSNGGRVDFYSTDYEGDIGKYHVKLNEFWHFNRRCTVVSIDLRPADEIERERRLKELGRFEGSEWVSEPKKRIDLELTLVRVNEFVRPSYSRYACYDVIHIYTFADADGNCYVWKSANWLAQEIVDGNGTVTDVVADPGDLVRMKATVKEHSEWKGIKQTVINRPKINEIVKAA